MMYDFECDDYVGVQPFSEGEIDGVSGGPLPSIALGVGLVGVSFGGFGVGFSVGLHLNLH
jgi:hypothetical protein